MNVYITVVVAIHPMFLQEIGVMKLAQGRGILYAKTKALSVVVMQTFVSKFTNGSVLNKKNAREIVIENGEGDVR
jgi:hypothetical protein